MNTKEITEYEQQGIDFLTNRNITMSVERTIEQNCPQWDKTECKHMHGHEYKITFKRGKNSASIKFWNSLIDAGQGNIPTAYDVLTCINIDLNHQHDTFENFCSDFGYDIDSISALKIYKAIQTNGKRLSRIFTDMDITAMQEVQ